MKLGEISDDKADAVAEGGLQVLPAIGGVAGVSLRGEDVLKRIASETGGNVVADAAHNHLTVDGTLPGLPASRRAWAQRYTWARCAAVTRRRPGPAPSGRRLRRRP